MQIHVSPYKMQFKIAPYSSYATDLTPFFQIKEILLMDLLSCGKLSRFRYECPVSE